MAPRREIPLFYHNILKIIRIFMRSMQVFKLECPSEFKKPKYAEEMKLMDNGERPSAERAKEKEAALSDYSIEVSTDEGSKPRDWKTLLARVYACVILIVIPAIFVIKMIIGNGLQSAEEIESFDGKDVFRTLFTVWGLQCLLNGIVIFRLVMRGVFLKSFWTFVNDSVEATGDDCSHFFSAARQKQRQRHSLIYALVGWLYIAGFVALFALANFGPWKHHQTAELAVVLCEPLEVTPFLLTLNFLCIFILNISWIFPVMFFATIVGQLRDWYTDITEVAADYLAQSRTIVSFPEHFQCIKAHYGRLCSLVDDVDTDFRFLAFVSYATNIPLSCFLILEISRISTESKLLTSVIASWLGAAAFSIAAISVSGSRLHEQSQKPLDSLYDMPTEGGNSSQLAQLRQFTMRLIHSPPGISVGGLFAVTYNAFLTVVTAIGSYSFLAIELAPADDGGHMGEFSANATETFDTYY